MTAFEAQNRAFGFFGTVASARSTAFAEAAWHLALAELSAAHRDRSAEDLAAFLDARGGRHLADAVLGTGEQTQEEFRRALRAVADAPWIARALAAWNNARAAQRAPEAQR